MIFPIGDDNRDRKIKPLVNYLFITANILVFIFLQDLGTNETFLYSYSVVPQEIMTGEDIVSDEQIYEDPLTGDRYKSPGMGETPVTVYVTLLTSMFMHGSVAHIFGNMLFLLIFGDNIENKLGHFRYFFFYIIVGLLASLAHVFTTSYFGADMLIPTLGASGAISGVLGGYMMLYPGRKVKVIIFYFVTQVPAIVAIGLWFVFQLISGLGALGAGSQSGGVAYGAHIGGFIAGFILIRFWGIGKK